MHVYVLWIHIYKCAGSTAGWPFHRAGDVANRQALAQMSGGLADSIGCPSPPADWANWLGMLQSKMVISVLDMGGSLDSTWKHDWSAMERMGYRGEIGIWWEQHTNIVGMIYDNNWWDWRSGHEDLGSSRKSYKYLKIVNKNQGLCSLGNVMSEIHRIFHPVLLTMANVGVVGEISKKH